VLVTILLTNVADIIHLVLYLIFLTTTTDFNHLHLVIQCRYFLLNGYLFTIIKNRTKFYSASINLGGLWGEGVFWGLLTSDMYW